MVEDGELGELDCPDPACLTHGLWAPSRKAATCMPSPLTAGPAMR